jgi:hypothetical protein
VSDRLVRFAGTPGRKIKALTEVSEVGASASFRLLGLSCRPSVRFRSTRPMPAVAWLLPRKGARRDADGDWPTIFRRMAG